MEHEHEPGHAEGTARPAWPGIEHSIHPGVPCPETVLVAVMMDGSYLLLSHPQGRPAAFVAPKDATPLLRALASAFGNPTATSVTGAGRTPSAAGVPS